ncbi:hypothetical protein F511_28195 [Dorcoceras hygrometricum]|uniref:Uncharacterized protein n=1 Tax=Dorcoceras hygrometricum TaxID=472368 RepID=A0A2Z7APX3_9LAMI|nr:hypothetical protein F511_28195 [Dorcoceras hygrometricum]
MASAFITNALQVNFDSVLGISDNDEMVNMFKALESIGLRGFLLSCKKILMKYEFRFLNDILANSITVKAGSFDVVTHERFLMMTDIHFGIKVNWSKIIFEVLKEMVDRTTKRAKGFDAQICAVLKGDPAITLGEAKTFPPLKILSTKTKKSVSKKRSVSTAIKDTAEVLMETAAPAVKKNRETTGKATSKKRDLGLVSVAPEAVPIQMIEPILAVPAEHPSVHKRNAPKRKFSMPAGSDEEIVDKEPAVEEPILDESAGTKTLMKLETTTEIDDMDTIIEQILAVVQILFPSVFARKIVSGQLDEENPFVPISSGLLVQPDEGVSDLVVDRIGVNYHNLPRRAGFLKHRLEPGTSASKDLQVTKLDRVECQLVDPPRGLTFSAVPAERPPAPKRNALKRKFRMLAGSDDELVEKEPAGTEKMMELETTAEIDDVDTIISKH